MKQHWKWLAWLGVAIYGLSIGACSKSSELGLSLVEQERSDILYTDTVSMVMSSFAQLPLTGSGQDRVFCGVAEDPIFGKTTASAYMNFSITSTNVSFPRSRLDSLVLRIVYDTSGHAGGILAGTQSTQTWEVLQLEQLIDVQTTYKTDATFTLGNVLATDVQFVPNTEDSINVNEAGTNARKPAHLSIRLSDALGEALLHPADPNIYSNNNNFKNFFKGIYLRPKDGAANTDLLRLRNRHSSTRLTMYYTDTVDNGGSITITSKKFDFITYQDAESVIQVTHDYTNTNVLNNNVGDTAVYVQGLNGVGAKILFPHLNQLGDIIVNRAELQFFALDNNPSSYPAPKQIICMEKLSDGSYDFIDDIYASTFDKNQSKFLPFDGLINKTNSSNVYYSMLISEYLQRVADGETTDPAIYLQNSVIIDPNRTRLGNQQNVLKPARLLLTYTKR